MGNATVYKQDEKMLYFSVHGDAERWFHDTEAKKYPKDFNIKQIVVNDYNHDETQLFVEVVRCKDCQYRDTEDCPSAERQCFRNNIGVIKERWVTGDHMDYCSYGERREK